MLSSLIIVFLIICASCATAFTVQRSHSAVQRSRMGLKMEYIPSGLSKAQWAAIKKKEADEKEARKNGTLGTSRFKSRSFEAWHKAGGKHLFPVDPSETSYEERPYMQRKDGDWEGNDLKKKGLTGKGQGEASKRLKVDDIYEKAKKAGKLDSVSIFGGKALPWTNEAANKVEAYDPKKADQQRGVAGKKLSDAEMKRLKSNLAKVSTKQADSKAAVKEAPPKKKGWFS